MKSAKKTSFYKKIMNSKLDVVKNRKAIFIPPLVIMLIGMIILICFGFNKGIDFTGGTVMNVLPKTQDMSISAEFNNAKDKINNVLTANGVIASYFQIAETDAGKAISFRFQDKSGLTEDSTNDLNAKIRNELFVAFGMDASQDSAYIQSAQRISPTASGEFLMNAFLSILVAGVLILIYIAFRFELATGLSAILTLLHDVLITCSFVLIFRIQVNGAFIAALITIIGYSINDTIVIFDKLRENRKALAEGGYTNAQLVNLSVKQSLVRSLNTTTTTLLSILLLAIIGVPSIREFTIPIIIGLVAGTFSSIFIAPSLWVMLFKGKKIKNQTDSNEKPKIAIENEEIVISDNEKTAVSDNEEIIISDNEKTAVLNNK